MTNIYRQGDVLLVPTQKVEGAVEKGKAVLALGEVSGHSHRFNEAQFVSGPDGLAQTVILEKPTELIHEEHDTQTIPAGKYQVVIQRRVNVLGEIKRVLD